MRGAMAERSDNYSILIISTDSEGIEQIASCLRWAELPLNYYSAESISKAKEQVSLSSVDIVIADLETHVDGELSVVKALRAAGCKAEIIICSSEKDFELARAAIALRVSGYIVKPLDGAEVRAAVKRIIDELDSSAVKTKRMESLLLENQSLKANRILTELISDSDGCLSDSAEEFAAKTFAGKYVTLLFIETTEPIVSEREERILQLVLQYSREISRCLNLSESRELLFFQSEKLPGKKALRELGEYIRHKINATFAVDCFVMIGMPSPSGKKLSEVYARIENLSEYRFFMRQGAVLLDREKYFTGTNINEAIEGMLNHIYEDIRYGEYFRAADNIHLLVKTIEAETGLSNIYVRHIFIEILGKIAASSPDTPNEENLELVKYVLSASDIFAIEEKVVNTLWKLARRRGEEEKRLSNSDRAVEKVVKIIRTEYARINLSVEYLASRVFLSPNYLSVLFKKNKGMAINTFILDYRMEKARNLLISTNIKINEIARMVGYSSSSYFVTVFKSAIGMAPSQFRANNTGGITDGNNQ